MLQLPEPRFNGYEIAASVSLPFLPHVRSIHIHGELRHGQEASAHQLEYYRSLTPEDFPVTEELDDMAFGYYQDTARIIDVRDFGLSGVNRSNIGSHYRIELVTIPPLKGSTERFLILSGECDWDPEHGVQFIAKNSRIVACGESDGIFQGAGWGTFLTPDTM